MAEIVSGEGDESLELLEDPMRGLTVSRPAAINSASSRFWNTHDVLYIVSKFVSLTLEATYPASVSLPPQNAHRSYGFYIEKRKHLLIASQIHGPCCIVSARLVNKACSEAFSGKLYRHIRLQIDESFPTRVCSILRWGRLGNTRAISITTGPNNLVQPYRRFGLFPHWVQRAILALVRASPQLQALR